MQRDGGHVARQRPERGVRHIADMNVGALVVKGARDLTPRCLTRQP
jgi:hypothetical protein